MPSEKQIEALKDVLAHLVAAHSLLSRSPKTAAASDKMFDQMLADYQASIDRGREALTAAEQAESAPTPRSGAMNEKAVMVCPQCEGEGEYADGLDEAACSTPCTRCDGNGWIVDFSAIEQAEPALAAPCKHPVWGQDNDGTRACAKCGLVERPAARSAAVKVKAILELVQYHVTDDDDRASLTTAISALEPAEPATDAEPVAWSYEMANYLDNDGSYTGWVGPRLSFQKPNAPEGAVRNVTPLYTHPSEDRLHDLIANLLPHLNLTSPGAIDVMKEAMRVLGGPDAVR